MNRFLTAGVITIASVLAFIAWLIFGFLYYSLHTPLWMDVLLIFIIAGIALPIPIVAGLYIRERIQRKRTG